MCSVFLTQIQLRPSFYSQLLCIFTHLKFFHTPVKVPSVYRCSRFQFQDLFESLLRSNDSSRSGHSTGTLVL